MVEPPPVVVTGPTSGIGLATARGLAQRGVSLVLVGRDAHRLDSLAAELRGSTPSAPVETFVANLLHISEVRAVAERIGTDNPAVSGLVNNAGAVFTKGVPTEEGHERTWALNVLAPYLLTRRLLPALARSGRGRVVNVASAAHWGREAAESEPETGRTYRGFRTYAATKLALIRLTYEFARRLDPGRVTANALHPGFVRSRFGRANGGAFGWGIAAAETAFGISPERGARTPILLASDPSVAGVTGAYFVRGHPTRSSLASYDVDAGRRLWTSVSAAVGVSEALGPVDGAR